MRKYILLTIFFIFIVIMNFAVAWTFLPLLGMLDGDLNVYQNDLILWAFPYFENIARILFFIGMGLIGWLWFRISNWRTRLLRSSMAFVIVFSLVTYFNPSILLRSLFIPGWFVLSSIVGHIAPSKYAKDFSMSFFSTIKTGQNSKEVVRRLGVPLSEVENENGETVMYYSMPQQDGDYWRVGIQRKSNGIIARRIFYYYFD